MLIAICNLQIIPSSPRDAQKDPKEAQKSIPNQRIGPLDTQDPPGDHLDQNLINVGDILVPLWCQDWYKKCCFRRLLETLGEGERSKAERGRRAYREMSIR